MVVALHTTDCISDAAQGKAPTLPFELIEIILEMWFWSHGRQGPPAPPRRSHGSPFPRHWRNTVYGETAKRYSIPPAHPDTVELRLSLQAHLIAWRQTRPPNPKDEFSEIPLKEPLKDDHLGEMVARAPRILAYHADDGSIDSSYVHRLKEPEAHWPDFFLEELVQVLVEWAEQWKNDPLVARLTPRGFMKDTSSSSNVNNDNSALQALDDESPPAKRPRRT